MSRFLTPKDVDFLRTLNPDPEDHINAGCLADQTPRTLVFGYNVDRETHHLYIDTLNPGAVKSTPKVLVWVRYDSAGTQLIHQQGNIPLSWVFPNKRVYPECCDLELCIYMARRGFFPSFTNFDADRPHPHKNGKFWGRRLHETFSRYNKP